ncbi:MULTISPECIES: nucleotide exchange factor GrpE [Asticcacaulis]|uniref:nucleotide exchange factor GrpE n=1 Tax=Asticcacaulis TaxID=76890 RepID=UPI001AE11C06|nr:MULTISPECIES: nucleotide exchange factor GrpE [Asticcacaulis]MBP2160002.1 molecular chaperone GrpE [Asticcacaulis solisilvae]MDR6801047.1 molecular chaperone GrpE [Asticcacaulis sp. BE141]
MSEQTETPETGDLEQDGTELLNKALEELQAENAALKEQALRYAAEAENTKRRAEREANDARAFGIQRFATSLLNVADVLQRALASAPNEITDPAFKNFVAGIDMTEKELAGAFEKNGVKKIAPMKGDKFDPNLHQAVMEQPSEDVPGGSVIMVMQAGYELFGRVIRPAMVAVAAKSAGGTPAKNGYDGDAGEAAGETVNTQA